jgi:phospholipase/carboxylesterase
VIDRREFLSLGLAAVAWSCASVDPTRLTARPSSAASPQRGLRDLGLTRPALLYVPEKPSGAFALLLHGATGRPDHILNRFQADADAFGVTLLAPKSADVTWDAIRGSFGADPAFIDEALRAAFAQCSVDRKRLGVVGFSDGATYALALGRANGDLFSHILAFSPGFLIPIESTRDHPRVFLAHGTRDPILPIEGASRRIARDLRRENLSVTLREFDGVHTVPPEIARAGFEWFTGVRSVLMTNFYRQ